MKPKQTPKGNKTSAPNRSKAMTPSKSPEKKVSRANTSTNRGKVSPNDKQFKKQTKPVQVEDIDMNDQSKSKSRVQSAKSGKSSNASPMTTPRKGGKKRVSEESKSIEAEEEFIKPTINPKRPSTSYLFFTISQNKAQTHKDLKQSERMKKFGEEWKLLTDKDKTKYVKMAEDDVKRFEKETQELEEKGYFVNKDGIKSTDLKVDLKYFSIHTVLPQKGRSGMMFYIKENYNKNKEANPGLGLGEYGKINAQKWNELGSKLKAKYEKLASDDKERYHRELDQLQTLGYFTNSDGVKSTELPKKYTKQERQKLQKEKDNQKEKFSQDQEAKQK